MVKIVLVVLLFAHGVGHILFLAPALRLADWAGQTSHSWILTAATGDGITRALGAAVWSVSTVLFLAAVAGLMGGSEWWRMAAVAGALVSLAGIVVFWDGIATSSAFFAFVFNLLVLIALLVARWPAPESVGA